MAMLARRGAPSPETRRLNFFLLSFVCTVHLRRGKYGFRISTARGTQTRLSVQLERNGGCYFLGNKMGKI